MATQTCPFPAREEVRGVIPKLIDLSERRAIVANPVLEGSAA